MAIFEKPDWMRSDDTYVDPFGQVTMRTNIIGTSFFVYDHWVPSSYMGHHATLMTIDGKVYGRIGTNRLPKELDERLPAYSDERSEVVAEWYDDHYKSAYAAIKASPFWPEIERNGEYKMSGGEVTMTVAVPETSEA